MNLTLKDLNLTPSELLLINLTQNDFIQIPLTLPLTERILIQLCIRFLLQI